MNEFVAKWSFKQKLICGELENRTRLAVDMDKPTGFGFGFRARL